MGELQGKIALVTGAGSGIGRAIALAYAREGAQVVVGDAGEESGRETVALITENGGGATFVAADVAQPADCEAMVAQAVTTHGRLDIACNNAGISGGMPGPVADYPLEVWQRVIAVNLSGVFYCLKYELAAMVAAGGGAIINIASILGLVGFARAPAYVAAKHGVVGLTRSAALEYAAAGIRVNAIAPGFITTPMIAGIMAAPELEQQIVGLHPLGRLGQPEEIAELALWLVSPRASFVTGVCCPVDGGYTAR